MSRPRKMRAFISRLSPRELSWIGELLKQETIGGGLLLLTTVLALVISNSEMANWYTSFSDTAISIDFLNLHFSLAHFAADGLLSIFFLVVGLELKHELTIGSLSVPARAAVPISAAIGGMALPALIFVAINQVSAGDFAKGWGIPMATDIAFALAVLSVFGKRLPIELRAFLLTLAVVDDLGAIIVIAVFYSHGFSALNFAMALISLGLYRLIQQKQKPRLLMTLPFMLAAWYFMYQSGIHATISAVAIGLLTRVNKKGSEAEAPVDRLLHQFHPWSAGLAVPVFAFFAAGVNLSGLGVSESLSNPVFIAIVLALVLGKPLGILGASWLVARFTRAELVNGITWRDVAVVGVLGGIGFTVALLISDLAFAIENTFSDTARFAVLSASALSTLLGAIALNRAGRS